MLYNIQTFTAVIQCKYNKIYTLYDLYKLYIGMLCYILMKFDFINRFLPELRSRHAADRESHIMYEERKRFLKNSIWGLTVLLHCWAD